MNVRNACIQEDNNKKERMSAGAWNEVYRAKMDREVIGRLVAQPKAVEQPLIMHLPSSAMSMRLQGGWYVPQGMGKSSRTAALYKTAQQISREQHPAFARDIVHGESVLPGYHHLPLMSHPKQKMPAFYGRSLHTQQGNYGTDPRAR